MKNEFRPNSFCESWTMNKWVDDANLFMTWEDFNRQLMSRWEQSAKADRVLSVIVLWLIREGWWLIRDSQKRKQPVGYQLERDLSDIFGVLFS
jgi:hypothetical protein